MKNITSILFFSILLLSNLWSQDSSNRDLEDYNWESELKTEVAIPDSYKPQAKATCFCVVSYKDITNQRRRDGVCLDLTKKVNKTYKGLSPQREKNRNDCNKRCTKAAASLSNSTLVKVAKCACTKGVKNGTRIQAYSSVGNRKYRTSQYLGTLENIAPVSNTNCTCKTGEIYDKPNNKCKKIVCSLDEKPFPSNGTKIGNWGFTWEGNIWKWSQANCITTQVSPGSCRLKR